MEREFLTAAEVAALFDCCEETVKRMARAGTLPAFKFGRRWFFRKADIANLPYHTSSHLRRDRS